MIIQDHTTKEYLNAQSKLRSGKHNGAYYYSKEIVENFIPSIKTDYNWQTINHQKAPEHCIVFVHSNNALNRYDYLLKYSDVILVCSTHHSMEQLQKKGHKQVCYVPLSIDTNYLNNFKNDNKEGTIACGNIWAFTNQTKEMFKLNNITHYHDLERDELLTLMSKAETVYAIGRTAMEAIYLGANVIQPEKEYPVEKYDTYYTQQDAINILQQEIENFNQINESKNHKIIIGVATMNSRKHSFKRMMHSVQNQTIKPDEVYVYNNDENDYDATDNGKFYYFTLNKKEDVFFFSMDDDILYPPTYIEDMIKWINKYQCIITHHGRDLREVKSNYYTDHLGYSCLQENNINKYIDVMGTGVSAFDTSIFSICGKPDFIFKDPRQRMTDLILAEYAAANNIKIRLVPHPKNYLKDICEDTVNSCHTKEKNNNVELKNNICKKILNNRTR